MHSYKSKSIFLFSALVALSLVGCANTQEQDNDPLHEQLFHQWFAAEFDNHEQHWQDSIDKKKNPELQVHEHIHHVFAPIESPVLDGKLYFVKQYMDGDPNKVYRQRLYQFVTNQQRQALQLNIYRFDDDKQFADAHLRPDVLQSLTKEQITTYPGCEVYWTFNGEYFDGTMDKDACRIVSKRSGKTLVFNDTLRLTDNEIWISDVAHDAEGNYIFGNKAGIPHKNRKVTYFTGWGGAQVGGKDADADAPWHFTRNLILHNEGQIVPIYDDDTGEKSGYSIQLALLTYQNTSDPIFKFGLIDDETGKTITYIWSDQSNPTTGMNLRWMQAGLKRKTERPHFRF